MSGTDRFEHGLVIGKFYPPHAGHHFLIRSAASSCRRVTVVAMAADVESIPLSARVSWLREAYADQPHVCITGVVDNIPVDYGDADVWDGHVALMREGIAAGQNYDIEVDSVFGSESYGRELARRFNAADVRLDGARDTFPVSGTAVRRDPMAHWLELDAGVRAWFAKRVVVVGAESTGTTTLSTDLAAALRARGGLHAVTGWVGEYGRELTVAKLAAARGRAARAGKPKPTVFDLEWTDDDFVDVVIRQTADEDRWARLGGPVLVCDTDALATTIWQERYMGRTTPEVAELAAELPRRALYILTDDADVPFDDDGLRDGEHLRGWMTQRFREVLAVGDTPWIEVGGDREKRLRTALDAVDALLSEGWRLADPLG